MSDKKQRVSNTELPNSFYSVSIKTAPSQFSDQFEKDREIDRLKKIYGSDYKFDLWTEGKGKNTMSAIKGIGSIAGSYANSDNKAWTKLTNSGIDTLMNLNPYTAIANAALNTINAGLKAAGIYTPEISKADKELLNLKGTGLADVAKAIKLDNIINGIAGKKIETKNSIVDRSLASPAWSGSVNKHDAWTRLNGRHYAAKKQIEQGMNQSDSDISNINDIVFDTKRRQNNMAGQIMSINDQLMYSGHKPGLTLANGGTIPELESARASILSLQSKRQEESSETQKFQLGGKMNMIVTGALHARKHNLEELNPVLEGEITKKGVPVVTFDEGGEVDQQLAEVEQAEIIMTLDATKTIEDYYKDYIDADTNKEADKAALECGKFLVDQILKNTDDPDKLIKKTV